MADFSFTALDVNGDPAPSGWGINIVKGQTMDMVFQDVDDVWSIAQSGGFVS